MEPPGVTVLAGFLRIAVLLAVVACSGPAPSAPASSSASTSPTATPAPTAAATHSPTPSAAPGLFGLVGTEPVIRRTTFEGRGAVLPAAVTRARNGTYHAWVVAFAALPGTQDVHHLTSADALRWAEQPDPSLAGLSAGMGNPGAIPDSVLETADGWVMYLVATPATEERGFEIWRATAPGPGGPWSRGLEPVLRRGDPGSWDHGVLDFPTVIPTEDGYTMFYSAIPALVSDTGSVGLATSPDGIAWTKQQANPVAGPGLCGGFDERAVGQPRVVVDGDRLLMAYAGYHGAIDTRAQVGLAESRDSGLTWTCLWPSNALTATGLPPGGFVHTLTAFPRGDRVALLVEWFAGEGTDDWLVEAESIP
jgi:fermentation-respiration switch protein FrsA (DUF1100 family)